jgi:hypothetical protein
MVIGPLLLEYEYLPSGDAAGILDTETYEEEVAGFIGRRDGGFVS